MSFEYRRCALPMNEINARSEPVTVHCTLIAGHEGRCAFAFTMMQAIRDQARKIGKIDTRRIA